MPTTTGYTIASHTMFSLFKSNPTKKLQKSYERKLEEAMQAQRKGDIKSYSLLTEQAENILSQIRDIEASSK